MDALWMKHFVNLEKGAFFFPRSEDAPNVTASSESLLTRSSIIYAHLHSCNTLFIKSKQHSSQFPSPISVSVSESFNNIWRYALAQARSKRRGNTYFQNWNWDVLFTAFAISFKILQFILISTHLNFIRLRLSEGRYSGMFSWSMSSVWFTRLLCRSSESWRFTKLHEYKGLCKIYKSCSSQLVKLQWWVSAGTCL